MSLADARSFKALLICPHRATMTELIPFLAEAMPVAPLQKLTTFPGRKEVAELLRTFEAKVCFLDFASPGNDGFETLAILHDITPDVIVIALLSGTNPDLVLRCLRAGASDFLVAPFTAEQVSTVIEKISRRVPAAEPSGPTARVVAVVPVKGGTGATTVACNLAFQCHRLGRKRVLLADMDGLSGSVSFVLKVKSNYSFLDVLHHAGALEEDIWKQMVSPSHNIDVLLAPDAVVDPTAELSSAAPILDFAAHSYDVVIADTGGPEGDWNLSILRAAHEVLLVTTNELPELDAAQRALICLEACGIERDKMRLIVNRYRKECGLAAERIEGTLGREVFDVLPVDDQALDRSLLDGKAVSSGTPVGKSIARMAARLLEAEKPGSGRQSARLLGFLSRE